MNELEARMVLHYIDEYLFEPVRTWPKQEFEDRTFSRWAAYEIVQRLMDAPFDPPDLIVESFIFELAECSYLAKDPEVAEIFLTAKEAAEVILCLLV